MTQLRVIPEQSQLWIEARSSLHPIHGEGIGIEGEVDLEIDDGRIALSGTPKARIGLPVEHLRSGNALQDMEMRRRVEAQKYPTIVGELVKATALSRPGRYRLQGDLTFHGIARRLEADATATFDGQGFLRVEGEYVLDVRGFEVTPPRILGLRVYPEIKVRFRVVAEGRKDA